MNKQIAVIFLLLTASLQGSGQKIVPSPADLYAEVLEYMFAGDYSEALPILLALQERGLGTANISYKIGECYLNTQGQKAKAIPYLKEAVQNISGDYSDSSLEQENAPVKSLLYLGIAYRLNNDLDNAVICFKNYLNAIDNEDQVNRALAENHIAKCEHALELMASPAVFSTDTLPESINSLASNFRPVVTADEKVLCYMNQLKFYDAVMQATRADTVWQIPENLTPEIKSDGDHYITGISADGARLFLTAYDPYRSGEIYTTVFREGKWSDMMKLEEPVNSVFNESHATLSPDGKSLYFTSDRKGGYGGLDLYRSSFLPDGRWSSPENLGPLINTPFNEESPFVSSDARTLFFSSQGHYNMGGYDIFRSSLDPNGQWLPPVNLGYPLNTTDDDLFFFPIGTGQTAYQARLSSSGADLDIVRFEITSFGHPARFTINGRVNVKAEPGYDPGQIFITFIDKQLNDTVSRKSLQHDGTFRQKLPGGEYTLDFSSKDGSLLSRELVIPEYLPDNEFFLQTDITVPGIRTVDTLEVRDIRFAFDQSALDEKYQRYLDEVIQVISRYPGLDVQINGYADSRGNENYNMKLSLARARAVEEYFKNRNVLTGSVSVNAYGEKAPVALNTNADGTDNPLGRSYNRRVELVITQTPAELITIRFSDVPGDILIH
jgi:outer membrane protein OmpA-like peptidoglycan-associated protein/tetratricopeptide (TPR) repeat protein